MNYFAHGIRFLDRPWFVAGTAVPDWLSVADRPVRVRSRDATPFADGSGTPLAEIAAGVLQHLTDDDWFHRTAAFVEVSHHITRAFRELLEHDDSPRAPFLGHIVTEILLDAILVERHPGLVERYYRQLESIDGRTVQDAVNRMAKRTTDRLDLFVGLFCRERFLRDYPDPERLCWRLTQVLSRVKLDPLPPEAIGVLKAGREIVEGRMGELLPGFGL